MSEATYRVEGMTCDGCVRALTRSLKAHLPAAELSVDLGGGTVTVRGDAPESEVAVAVDEAGFNFRGRAA